MNEMEQQSPAPATQDPQSLAEVASGKNEVEFAFLAKICNAKIIYDVLNGIHFKKDQVFFF